jgi:heptosyltransferase-2
VLAHSLIKQLHQQYPASEIDVLVDSAGHELTQRMPEVAASIVTPLSDKSLQLAKRFRLARTLAQRGYERAYILPNSLVSALVPALAGIKTRTGWRGQMRFGLLNDIRPLSPKRYPSTVERFVALAVPLGAALPDPLPAPQLQPQPELQLELCQRYQLSLARPVLMLALGAEAGPAAEQYTSVLTQHIAAGGQVWLWAAQEHTPRVQQLQTALPAAQHSACRVLTEQAKPVEVLALVAATTLVISEHEGIMHAAAAFAVPLLALAEPSASSRSLTASARLVVAAPSTLTTEPLGALVSKLASH